MKTKRREERGEGIVRGLRANVACNLEAGQNTAEPRGTAPLPPDPGDGHARKPPRQNSLVPKGPPRIAQCFSIGIAVDKDPMRPEGTPETGPTSVPPQRKSRSGHGEPAGPPQKP